MILTINRVISLNVTNRVALVMKDYEGAGVLMCDVMWTNKQRQPIAFETSVTVYWQKQFNPHQHKETPQYQGELCVL